MITLLPARPSLPPPLEWPPPPPEPAARQPTLFGANQAPVSRPSVEPQLASVAQAIVVALVEVLQGRRSSEQLVRWVDEEPLAELVRQARAQRRRPPTRLCSVRAQPVLPASGRVQAAEVSVRLADDQRSRALAVRIERRGDRWMCSELLFGP